MRNRLKAAIHGGFLELSVVFCAVTFVILALCPLRAGAQEGPESLTEYAAQAQGSVTLQLLDGSGREVSVESLVPGQNYLLSLTLDFPHGLLQGVYYYDLPGNTVVLSDSPEGQIIKENAEPIGSYRISGNRILFTFDREANASTDVWGKLSAGLRVAGQAAGDAPVPAAIRKSGGFRPESGTFSYTITAAIPAGWQNAGEWYLTDHAEVGEAIYYPAFAGAVVLLDGAPLPEVSAAAAEDSCAYRLSTAGAFTRLTLVNRCTCTGETCTHWTDEGCRGNQNGWCACWRHSRNTTLTVRYSLPESVCHSLLQSYPDAQLYNIVWLSETVRAECSNHIPRLLEKSMTEASNGQTRTYTLQINPERLDLSAQEPLVIKDTMSGMTWAGGLTVLCNGSVMTQGFSSEVSEDQRVLTVTLDHPANNSYTIRYRTRLDGDGSLVRNVAALDSLYGGISRTVAGGSSPYFSGSEWRYRQLSVTLHKTGEQGEPLAGAVYGLYNDAGELLAQRTSDERGECLFSTSLEESLPLRAGVLYYIQELRPPDNYALDSTRHWFYFSESPITQFDVQHSGSKRFAGSAGELYAADELQVWKLRLTKVDAADPAKPLEGAQLALFALSCAQAHDHGPDCYGTPVQSETTGADGVITLNIKKSIQYLLKETQAPAGYQCPGGGWRISAKDSVRQGDSPFEIIAVDSPDGRKPPAFRLTRVETGNEDQTVTGCYDLYNVQELAVPFSGGGGRWRIEWLGAGLIFLAVMILWRSQKRGKEQKR